MELILIALQWWKLADLYLGKYSLWLSMMTNVNLGTEAHFIRFIKLWENHNITLQLLKLLSFLLSFPAWEEKTWLWLRTLTQLAGSKEKSWTWCLVFSLVSPEWYVSWTLHIQSVGLLFKDQWLQISCEKDFFHKKYTRFWSEEL